MRSLYRRILAEKYRELPQAIQDLHDVQQETVWHGVATIERGKNWIARRCADVLSLPPEGENIAVCVRFTPYYDGEIWHRDFGGKVFKSFQYQKDLKISGMMHERLRFTTLVFRVIATTEGLELVLCDLRILGIPALAWLRPRVIAREAVVNGQFHFYIDTHLPILGRLVTYHGFLVKK